MARIKNKPTIGIIVSDLFDAYQKSIWKGVTFETKQQNARVLCFHAGAFDAPIETYKYQNPLYDIITHNNVDVLLLMSGSLSVYSGLPGLQRFIKKKTGIPVISIAIPIPGVPSVVVDNYGGMYSMVNHMIKEHQCKRIAFIKGPDTNEEATQRYNAYKDSLKEHGIGFDPQLIVEGDFWITDGEKAVKTLVDERQVEMDALVSSDDQAIIYALPLLTERGYRIPEDIYVTGFDDVEKSQYCTPPLTTVRQPLFEMGTQAVQIALSLYAGQEVPELTKVDTRLILRESCGCSVTSKFDSLASTVARSQTGDNNYLKTIDKLRNNVVQCTNSNAKGPGYIDQKIQSIVEALLDSLKNNDIDIMLTTIDDILVETYDIGFTSSFWSSILTKFILMLAEAGPVVNEISLLTRIWNKAQLKLAQSEIRLRAFEKLMQVEVHQETLRVGNKLTTSLSFSSLKETLRDDLPIIKINHVMIVLYKKDHKKSFLLFYRGNEDSSDYEYLEFETTGLYPAEIERADLTSYITLPIVINNIQRGFVLFEISNVPDKTYDFLAAKISKGISNIETIEQLNNHTLELEKLVNERTLELQKSNEILKEQTYKDQLTGLYNRRFLMEVILPQAGDFLEEYRANKNNVNTDDQAGDEKSASDSLNNSYVIYLIDLDHFKSVNDTYGHDAGDAVLVQIGNIFKDVMRTSDYLVRMGGEEFLLILKKFNVLHLAKIAEKVRKAVEDYNFTIPGNKTLKCTCSIGCTVFPVHQDHPASVEFLNTISIADKALYYAKSHGRNCSIIINLNEKFFYTSNNIEHLDKSLEECIESGAVSIINASESH